MTIKYFFKRIFKIILYGFLSVIAIIVIVLFSFWVEIKSNVTLPIPTGKFEVGRIALNWIDSSRTDSLSPKPYSKRELVVWIWYPASVAKSDSVVDYDRAVWEKKIDFQTDFLFRNFFARDGSKIHPHGFLNSKLSDSQAKYPILIMKSGIGTRAIDYTTIAEDLASHGYIVVGSDAPYSTFRVVLPTVRQFTKLPKATREKLRVFLNTQLVC